MNEYESLLRTYVDPENALPPVSLVPVSGVSVSCMYNAIVPESYSLDPVSGERVGEISVRRIDSEGDLDLWTPSLSWLEPVYRGKGFGSSMYLAAAGTIYERGGLFRSSDGFISNQALTIWRRFIDQGIAQVITDYLPEREGPRFIGGEIRLHDFATLSTKLMHKSVAVD